MVLYASIIVLVFGVYHNWKAKVGLQATEQYRIEQVNQANAEREKAQKSLKVLEQEKENIEKALEEKKTEFEKKINDIQNLINNSKDRPSSEVLKETIRRLK